VAYLISLTSTYEVDRGIEFGRTKLEVQLYLFFQLVRHLLKATQNLLLNDQKVAAWPFSEFGGQQGVFFKEATRAQTCGVHQLWALIYSGTVWPGSDCVWGKKAAHS
jgi:hypothetical protein